MFYCSVSRISINDFFKSVSSIMLLLNELNLIFYSYYFITKISFLFFCLPKIHQFYYKKLNLPVTWQHSWHRNWLYFLITITVSLFDISKTFLHLNFFFLSSDIRWDVICLKNLPKKAFSSIYPDFNYLDFPLIYYRFR